MKINLEKIEMYYIFLFPNKCVTSN